MRELQFRNEPVFEAVAADGTGVFETLKGIIKLVLLDLNLPGLDGRHLVWRVERCQLGTVCAAVLAS